MTENIGTPPSDIPKNIRTSAMLCHILALVGLLGNGIGFLLAPLIYWTIKKDEDPFVNDHGKESVNFQLTMLILMLISGLLSLVVIGFIFLAVFGLMMIIFPIIAGLKANDGETYRYPMTYRFIK